ncbi:DUF2235 domain-containing protein [Mesorhizobium sp. M7A.F.Ca.CA.001.09.2.1]|uniref:DUF2235 domain-containing protein n=1 Tax=Mesorhizobium ciceri TaxID=39645 RepID=A0AB38TJH1_9HYPH|nr:MULTISPECIES: DUF2235 domain-containing protein [Mesorhizobium]RUY59247.1 DUF2235 domain-containing protein [Mesorhizobium sp. M7A.F.Ca.CA.001.13.2.1]MDF3217898.1 DUF2235 domain-containing protein [Mesorhizobium ciceri]RUY66470.1 DUF2235 domain-containing protein [Mesorhizobium sp. M7A.F.Ca.CA.001.05.1.1]RUY68351.1 DUF2235 domain-containing protein [Mesorhizobium sp. M7A.F.Ca.CA.001.13.1.1]RUY77613.1 DUF2235 domain-containing protein [Mesorhizobium sp. M7A.F.Ca.CA.001.09.2.1]
MARNLILLLDGTSNEVNDNLTNVVKLFRCAERSDSQRVFYHPGIGTVPLVTDWSPARQSAMAAFGLATGCGLDANILAAYCYLIDTYQPGDRIFLFGFSRGAYTARAVAGLIHLLGLLEPDQHNLVDYALKAYKRAHHEDSLEAAWQFRRVIGGRRVPVHFLGVWDTVASVFVRPGLFRLPTQSFLPYTKSNPSVRVFRQAAAIDERRRMFRLYSWTPRQSFRPDPFAEAEGAQNEQTVWFAGDHSDVGGGWAEAESQIAKFPLVWMTREAQKNGFRIDESMFRHLAEGDPLPGGKRMYVAPDAKGPIHNSMTAAWWPLEFLPKNRKWKCFPEMSTGGGYYLPRAEPRNIPEGALLHHSVIERMATGYKPTNLPDDFTLVGPSTGATCNQRGQR